jgi:hypothetical protein
LIQAKITYGLDPSVISTLPITGRVPVIQLEFRLVALSAFVIGWRTLCQPMSRPEAPQALVGRDGGEVRQWALCC